MRGTFLMAILQIGRRLGVDPLTALEFGGGAQGLEPRGRRLLLARPELAYQELRQRNTWKSNVDKGRMSLRTGT
jgi:hypothetical protein